MALQTSLGELLHHCAQQYSGRPFLTMAPSGETLSYEEFEALTNQISHGLREHVNTLPSHIAIMLENSPQYLAITYALKKLGPIEVSINRTFRGPSLARTIKLTNTPLLITSSVHFDAIASVIDDISNVATLIVCETNTEPTKQESAMAKAVSMFPELNIVSFDTLLTGNTTHLSNKASDLSPASIMFTSGTTGVSKGCLLSHRYAIRTAENLIAPFRITSEDTIYSPYPLSHIGPAYYDILPTMITGGRVILRDGFSLSHFWPEVKKFGATWFLMLGSVQQLLWAAPTSAEEKQHKVSRCWATPAPVPKKLFDERFNTHLIPGGGYGSTDAGWIVAPQWDHPGGIVLPEFEVAIVDDNDNPLPPDTNGEMLVRAKEPGIMSDEYFGMPEETRHSRRNGWFHTGDIAKLDKEGLFYFVCRKAERIRVRGEMVSGFEVEEGILSHPDIEDCAVIGVKSPLGEEDIKAFVVTKALKSLSAADIRSHCQSRMAKHMIPVVIEMVDEIPRTPTGKVEKGRLSAQQ